MSLPFETSCPCRPRPGQSMYTLVWDSGSATALTSAQHASSQPPQCAVMSVCLLSISFILSRWCLLKLLFSPRLLQVDRFCILSLRQLHSSTHFGGLLASWDSSVHVSSSSDKTCMEEARVFAATFMFEGVEHSGSKEEQTTSLPLYFVGT